VSLWRTVSNHRYKLIRPVVSVHQLVLFFTVINLSITTKTLFVSQRFDFRRKSSSGEWKLKTIISSPGSWHSKSCAKKAVVRVAELVAVFFAVHGWLSCSFLMCIASLIHWSILLLSLSITLARSHSMTWLIEMAWSVTAGLFFIVAVNLLLLRNEPRPGVLSTSTHLWLFNVRRSDAWQTVVPKKTTIIEKRLYYWSIYLTYFEADIGC